MCVCVTAVEARPKEEAGGKKNGSATWARRRGGGRMDRRGEGEAHGGASAWNSGDGWKRRRAAELLRRACVRRRKETARCLGTADRDGAWLAKEEGRRGRDGRRRLGCGVARRGLVSGWVHSAERWQMEARFELWASHGWVSSVGSAGEERKEDNGGGRENRGTGEGCGVEKKRGGAKERAGKRRWLGLFWAVVSGAVVIGGLGCWPE